MLLPVHWSSNIYLAKNYIPYIKITCGGNIRCVFLNLIPSYKVREFSMRNKISADRWMDFWGEFTARISNVAEGDEAEVE